MIKVASIVILITAGIGAYVWHVSQRPSVLEVYVFDTPGVASIFIRTPSDKRILINGGSNADIVRRVTKILPFYSRRIDFVIASDTQDKTINGLRDITDRYDVNKIIGMNRPQETRAGETILFDDDVIAEILFPADEEDFTYSNASPPQILMRIIHGQTSILFAGQATDKILRHIGVYPTSTDQVRIHKYMVNGINIKKNGPVRIVTDGRNSTINSI